MDDFDQEYKQLVFATRAIDIRNHQQKEKREQQRLSFELDSHFPEFQCYECWHRYRVKNPIADIECEVCATWPGDPEYNPDCQNCDEICDDYTPWEAGVTCPRCGSRYKVPVRCINEKIQFSLCLTDQLKYQKILGKSGMGPLLKAGDE